MNYAEEGGRSPPAPGKGRKVLPFTTGVGLSALSMEGTTNRRFRHTGSLPYRSLRFLRVQTALESAARFGPGEIFQSPGATREVGR